MSALALVVVEPVPVPRFKTRWERRLSHREANAKYRAGQIEAARSWYQHLLHVLGGRCVECGEDGTNCPLTIDHVMGRKWEVRRFRIDLRVQRYWREFHEGVYLRVLCHQCNSVGGTQMAMFYRRSEEFYRRTEEERPF